MADWEQRLAEDSQATRDELERRILSGDTDTNLGFFNVARNLIGQYLILFLFLIIGMIVALVIFLSTWITPRTFWENFLVERERVHAEQAAEAADDSR